jgi:hypothetical protein
VQAPRATRNPNSLVGANVPPPPYLDVPFLMRRTRQQDTDAHAART